MELFLFFFFWLLVGILAVVLFAWLVLGLRVQVVSEEERLVIYRLGAFNRVAGPGPVLITRMDTVERTLHVRNQPHNVRVDHLFIKGVPFGYTLTFWYGLDLNKAANGKREHLARMAQFSNEEIDRQVANQVRAALVSSLPRIETEYQAAGKEFFYNLLPIIPGLPEATKLLTYVREDLAKTLPAIGVTFDPDRPIIITGLHIGPDIAGSFSRGRVVQMLKEQFPGLSEEMLLQALASIEGIDFAHQRITLKSEGDAQAVVDFRDDEEEGMQSRVKVYPQARGSRAAQPQPSANPATPEPIPAATEQQLTKDDLTILKRVPA